MSKYLVCPLDGDPDTPYLTVTPNSTNLGQLCITVAGIGNPFYAFSSLPSVLLLADEIGANFDEAIICSDNVGDNSSAITAMLNDPPATGETNDGTNKVWKVA